MRRMDAIHILVSKGDLVRIDTIMRSMDYEPQENREENLIPFENFVHIGPVQFFLVGLFIQPEVQYGPNRCPAKGIVR